MNVEELIQAVKLRAENPRTRTDYADRGCPELARPASSRALAEAESALSFPLHFLHRKLLMEVGNGGFGPGDGLIGIPSGRLDDEGRSILELRGALWTDPDTTGLPINVVPLCDWGCAIWSCLDEMTGAVLTLDENGLTETSWSLHTWFADWVSGICLFDNMFAFEDRTITNPFTKEAMVVRNPTHAQGIPYGTTKLSHKPS